MKDIKPIETYYNGYRFRSRLEARWAVFFNATRISYIYEPEGFVLPDGTKYLPDFYLPDLDAYVEVKCDTPNGAQEVVDKCEKSIVWGGPIKRIIILSNVPEGRSLDGGIWHFPVVYWNDHPRWDWFFFHDGVEEDSATGNISAADYPIAHPTYRKTIKAESDFVLRKKRDPNYDPYEDFCKEDFIWIQEDANKTVFKALKLARQARFEHGETPIIKRQEDIYYGN